MATTKSVARKATSTVPAIEKKALAESNKSQGMRMLFDAGYTVTRVQGVFNAPYGYVYGVALRHGVIETAASRRAPRKGDDTRKPRAAARAAKVTKPVAKKATATKVSAVAARVAKASAAKAKPGRPTAARRAANRAPRAAQTA